MTNEQLEQALKIMHAEIKALKKQVNDLDKQMQTIFDIEIDAGYRKKEYWNIDNHINR